MINNQESITAKICSFARAYHSNYERDKIFDDYLAFDMMGKAEYDQIGSLIYHNFDVLKAKEQPYFKSEELKETLAEYLSPIPLSRIQYAENKLKEFAAQHQACQYVICGAGADTFAFRNDNPNIRIFEIDHPDTQKYKLQRIRDLEWNIPENVQYVPVNFEQDDMKKSLELAGFDQNKVTFFSILGVTYYLTLPIFERTVSDMADLSKGGSVILFDYPDETTHNSDRNTERVARLAQVTASLGETMKHGFTYPSLKRMLVKHNFTQIEHMTPNKIQKLFFEGRSDNCRAFENVHFIAATFENQQIIQ